MIPIQNIYYMLSYAFKVLNEQGYKQILTEEFDNVGDLCAAILSKGVSFQIKRGLGKEYILQQEPLSTIKGKIDITSSIKEQTFIKKQLICEYDEFSINSYMNRIIRTTMDLLIRSEISKTRKKEIRKLLPYFDNVKPIAIKSINWKIHYNRNNQTYQMLISICYLIIKGLIQTNTDGTTKLMDFLDEQRMHKLYEKFILEYYKKEHPEIKTTSSKIKWNVDDNYDDMLPDMNTDIMLSDGQRTLIIDAKYYSKTLQKQFNTHSIHSNNIYQIFAYIKNLDTDNSGNVSGMLLYAKTDELKLPNNDYKLSGNKVAVKTLDLDCDFSNIKFQLDTIIDVYFK